MLNVKGKSTTGSSVLTIDFDGAILAVDDLLRPGEIDTFVAPGFIDLQVNGFAGVRLQRPCLAARRHRPLHSKALQHRCHTFPCDDHHRLRRTNHRAPSRILSLPNRSSPPRACPKVRRSPVCTSKARISRLRTVPAALTLSNTFARPASTNSTAGSKWPMAPSASSPSRPNGRKRPPTSAPSFAKALWLASVIPKPIAIRSKPLSTPAPPCLPTWETLRTLRASQDAKLHLGPTRRRTPYRQLHRRRYPHPARLHSFRDARQRF